MKLALCRKCNRWGEVPATFKESKHFCQCPECKTPMTLCGDYNPKDLGFNAAKQVTPGLMSQKGY